MVDGESTLGQDTQRMAIHRWLRDVRPTGNVPQRARSAGMRVIAHVRDEATRELQREDGLQLLGSPRIAQTTPGDRVEAGIPKPLPRILPSVGHCESWRRDPVPLENASAGRVNGVAVLLG